MRKIFLIMVTLAIVLLSSCSSTPDWETLRPYNERDEEFTKENIINNHKYRMVDDFFELKNFNRPSGVCINNNKIIVLDSGDNCLYLFDLGGSYIDKIGTPGNGELQFLNPASIFFYNEQYYILDAKNYRIQILNKDFTYNSEISLNITESSHSVYSDLVVYDDYIYVTTNGLAAAHSYIYKIHIETPDIIIKIGNLVNGYVEEYNGNIYFNNSLELKKMDNGAHYGFSGENYVYALVDDKVSEVCKLPYAVEPHDFIVKDNYIYTLNRKYATLDKFDMGGIYIETIYKFEDYTFVEYLAYDEIGDYYIVSAPDISSIYRIERINPA